MMPISELPMGIFEQQTLAPPTISAVTSTDKESAGKAKAAARKLSGIMMDKWATVQGKLLCGNRTQDPSLKVYDARG